ncbi:MAG: hypothetical protein AAGH99_05285 [Planctomycetota bacterium]
METEYDSILHDTYGLSRSQAAFKAVFLGLQAGRPQARGKMWIAGSFFTKKEEKL